MDGHTDTHVYGHTHGWTHTWMGANTRTHVCAQPHTHTRTGRGTPRGPDPGLLPGRTGLPCQDPPGLGSLLPLTGPPHSVEGPRVLPGLHRRVGGGSLTDPLQTGGCKGAAPQNPCLGPSRARGAALGSRACRGVPGQAGGRGSHPACSGCTRPAGHTRGGRHTPDPPIPPHPAAETGPAHRTCGCGTHPSPSTPPRRALFP